MDPFTNFIKDLLIYFDLYEDLNEEVAFAFTLLISFLFGIIVSAVILVCCRRPTPRIQYDGPGNDDEGRRGNNGDDEPPRRRRLIPNGPISHRPFG
ncbi:hypothetical protein AVEN_128421-1 [Araneus ventricosus]|uniref:Uncharacterized protein n=1 Tax=Araneus ventricosus TaxID=182803 RepID=A0A4Y2GMF0_ARAVE|nr:hypothetical protein AVEN_128421-1 [Araneus ventricosus]